MFNAPQYIRSSYAYHFLAMLVSEQVNVNLTNLSNLKTGKARAIRFTTLNAICRVLDCKPRDILDYEPDSEGIVELDDVYKAHYLHSLISLVIIS